MAREWLASQLQLKQTTLSGYRHSLEKHVLPRWGKVRLADVAHGDVQAWVNALTKTLAPSTVRQILLALSGVLKYSIRDGRLLSNASDDIRLPRIKRERRGYLDHDQAFELARACGGYEDVILFLAYTGLRWGEMAALRVNCIDLPRRRVEVREAVAETRGQLVWGTPKSHERRSVPFPDFLVKPLQARSGGKQGEDLVFTTHEGAVLRGGNFRNRKFDPALKAVQAMEPDFPKITPHDLRHTAASLAVSAGANVKAVQRMLGHASAAMTLDVYADLFDDDLDAVAAALDLGAAANVVKMWSNDAA
nr:site-specific integrase [Glaciibacter superstes]